MTDYIVVGAGFSGATVANLLAQHGNRVTLIEKREVVGGNMYDYKDESGSYVHMYGPHIFHTSMERVYSYLAKFSDLYPYYHKVFGNIDGQIVPIPFNFDSIDRLFDEDKAKQYKKLLQEAYPGVEKIVISELLQSQNQFIKEFAEFVYQKVFYNYTKKHWGVNDPSELDGQVMARVPVALSYKNGYFTDPFQAMPEKGYHELFKNMVSHKNITLRLQTDALEVLQLDAETGVILYEGEPFEGKLIYTGQIDELFNYELGKLEYRTVDFKFETLDVAKFQDNSVINYPNDHDYLRITEFKHFMESYPETDKTTIVYEFPRAHQIGDVPYYPVPKTVNAKMYAEYIKLSQSFGNLHLLGRLAEYKYFNMDQTIDRAMQLVEQLLDVEIN